MTQVREPWVVVLSDPQTGGIESFGPYSREEAERLRYWCTAELDLDELGDVLVLAAPMRA